MELRQRLRFGIVGVYMNYIRLEFFSCHEQVYQLGFAK